MVGAFHQQLERRRATRSRDPTASSCTTNAVVSPRALEVGKVLGPGEDLAAALEPVLRRHALQRRDDRSFDARHRVAPRACACRSRLDVGIRPPVGDAGAADERHASVDDEQLAVRAVVDPRQRVPPQPLVRLDPAPGLAQPAHRPAPQAEAADRVDDDGHVDARCGPRSDSASMNWSAIRPGLEDVHSMLIERVAPRIASSIAG